MKNVGAGANGIRRGVVLMLAVAVCLLGLAGTAQAATFKVTVNGDPTTGDQCANGGACSLRQAVADAQAAGSGNTVTIPSSASSYVLTQGTPISISTTLAVTGAGPTSTVIDAGGNLNGQSQNERAFVLSGGAVTIDGLTVTSADDGTEPSGPTLSGSAGGGAVYNSGANLTVSNDVFSDDSSPLGGAVSNAGGTLTLTDTSFTNDGTEDTAFGGGLFVRGGTVTANAVTFANDGPGAYGGGAVFLYGGTTTLTNTTVVGSGWASGRGGGIENSQGTLTLQYDTLSGNVRGSLQTDSGNAVTSVGDTIIGSGFSDGIDFGCVSSGQPIDTGASGTAAAITHDLGNNVDQDNKCGLSGNTDKLGVDPDLASLADNGGSVQTEALLFGSQAIDAGNAASCPATDAAGTVRPQNTSCDIGAFEAVTTGGAPTVSTSAASEMTSSSAELGALVNLSGEAGGLQFEWGTSLASLTNITPELGLGILSTNTHESQELDGLAPGTTYYVKAVAGNASQIVTATGPIQFTTLAAAPTIANVNNEMPTDTGAKIDFTINPNGADTKYVVEYGPDTDHLTDQPAVDIGSTAGDQDLTATLSGLTPDTAYVYDIVASNSAGSTDAGAQPFQTATQVTGTVGQPVELTDVGNFDGDCPSVTVEWGDGSDPQDVTPNCNSENGNVTVNATHTYSQVGDYEVMINYDDGEVIDFQYAQIAAAPPGPSISNVESQSVTDTGATIGSTIDPNGADTTYVIEYGPAANRLTSTTPPVDIGSASADQSLSATLTGLSPGSEVFYEVVATNTAGSSASAVENLMTDAQFTGTAGQQTGLVDTTDLPDCPDATVDWGDGSPTQDVQTACTDDGTGGMLVRVDQTHIYTQPGQYVVGITYGSDEAADTQYAVIASPPAPAQSTTTSSTSTPAATQSATSSSTTTSTTSTTSTSTAVPPPVLYQSENVAPVSGVVLIELPLGATLSRVNGPRATASATAKGRHFIPLTQARQIPLGSILDTRRGTVSVTAASATGGPLSTGDFSAGVFTLLQNRAQRGVTQLNLQDSVSRAKVCTSVGQGQGKGASATTAGKKVSNAVLGLLKSTDHGKFSTRGSYSSATVRGTQYRVEDTCAGTLTTVLRGSVAVDYFRRHKTVIVNAGHAFLAKASGGKSAVTTVGK